MATSIEELDELRTRDRGGFERVLKMVTLESLIGLLASDLQQMVDGYLTEFHERLQGGQRFHPDMTPDGALWAELLHRLGFDTLRSRALVIAKRHMEAGIV